MESSISIQSKKLLYRWKKIVWTSSFYKKQWRKHMFLYYLINIWKIKQSSLKKTLSHLTGLTHLRGLIWNIFTSPVRDPDKIKQYPISAAWLTFHMNTLYFYRSFLRKVRSRLGELARLTGPAHLQINRTYIVFVKDLVLPFPPRPRRKYVRWLGRNRIYHHFQKIAIRNWL